MTKEEARALLVSTLHDASGALDNGSLSPRLNDPNGEIRIEELEIDSLTTIEWGMKIEEQAGIEIDPAVLKEFETLGELAAHLAAKAQ